MDKQAWIIEYWPQLTFSLLGLGYVIQSFWGQILKKKEIKFSHTLQYKIAELKNYLLSYNELVYSLNEYYQISGQNLKDQLPGVKEKVYRNWTKFLTSYSVLRIFIKNTDYGLFDKIKAELEEVQKRIVFNEIDKAFGTRDKEDLKKYRDIEREIFPKKLPALIIKIEEALKNDLDT